MSTKMSTKMPKITGRQDDAASAASTKAAGGCYYCKQDGHVAKECPQLAAKKARAARMAEWQCRFCYQKGHLKAECPQQAAQKEAERAYIRAPPALTLGRVGLVTRRQ